LQQSAAALQQMMKAPEYASYSLTSLGMNTITCRRFWHATHDCVAT